MKKILITATVLFLTACSSAPNIVGTNKPILNMAANLAPALTTQCALPSLLV